MNRSRWTKLLFALAISAVALPSHLLAQDKPQEKDTKAAEKPSEAAPPKEPVLM